MKVGFGGKEEKKRPSLLPRGGGHQVWWRGWPVGSRAACANVWLPAAFCSHPQASFTEMLIPRLPSSSSQTTCSLRGVEVFIPGRKVPGRRTGRPVSGTSTGDVAMN